MDSATCKFNQLGILSNKNIIKSFLFWDEKMLFGNSFMYMADIIYYGLVHIKFIYRTSQAEIIQKQY